MNDAQVIMTAAFAAPGIHAEWNRFALQWHDRITPIKRQRRRLRPLINTVVHGCIDRGITDPSLVTAEVTQELSKQITMSPALILLITRIVIMLIELWLRHRNKGVA